MSFEHASVIITGGSKGIGLSIAKVFSRATERTIVLVARNKDDLARAEKECLEEGANEVVTLSVDLTDEVGLSKIDFKALKPGILVNNAGVFLFKKLGDTNSEEFNRQYQLNTFSTFNFTRSVLSALETQNRALIVNICSQASMKGYGDSGAYTMSKHALLGYTRSLRKELMDSGIAVSAINLGQTFSTSWEGVDIDPNKLIDPEDVGKLILVLSNLSPRSVAEEISLMPQGGEVNPM